MQGFYLSYFDLCLVNRDFALLAMTAVAVGADYIPIVASWYSGRRLFDDELPIATAFRCDGVHFMLLHYLYM